MSFQNLGKIEKSIFFCHLTRGQVMHISDTESLFSSGTVEESTRELLQTMGRAEVEESRKFTLLLTWKFTCLPFRRKGKQGEAVFGDVRH